MKALIAKTLLWVLARLPLRVNHALGSALGWLVWVIPNRNRQITQINLQRCFTQMPAQWQQHTARQSLLHTGRALTEAGYLWHHGHRGVTALTREVVGLDQVKTTLAEKGATIFVTPHLGAWEFAGLFVATLYPMSSMYRPARITALDETIRRGRSSTGAELVPATQSGVKKFIQALKKGEAIGLLPDQAPKKGTGVFAPFFGIQTYSMVLLNRLAGKKHIPVFFVFAERLPKSAGFRLHFMPAPEALYDADQTIATAAMNGAVETLIRKCPEQYLWSYKRFEHRPPGEGTFYTP